MGRVREEQDDWQARRLDRVFGSAPWLKPIEKKRFRVKVFKSGNSLALRLPAGLGLQAGTEMNLEVENGDLFTFEPVDRPKRKVNVAKFWGIAPELKPIADEDRAFDDSARPWDDPNWPGWDAGKR
jgi:antitoxin VapB